MKTKLLKPTALLAFGFALVAFAPAAQAESGTFNLHIDPAFALPVLGPLDLAFEGRNADTQDHESQMGFAVAVAIDWQLSRPWALEIILGSGGLFEQENTASVSDTVLWKFGVGARWRPLDNRDGYATESGGDIWGNLWVSGHIGIYEMKQTHFGVDIGLGYEFSVLRPLQIGPFVRGLFLFGGRGDPMDIVLEAGISFSIELTGEAPPPDQDGDGILDADEATHGTDPTRADSDGDGISDRVEVDAGYDPVNRDTDGDGLSDGDEDLNGDGSLDPGETDPKRTDTDGGGVPDADEVRNPSMDPQNESDDDSDGDGVAEPYDECQGTAMNTEVNAAGCPPLPTTFELEGVAFESGSADLTPTSFDSLRRAARLLRENAGVRVEIAGHTDNAGNARRNQRLSERRAQTVEQFFVEQGLDPSRFEVRGYGPDQPVGDNATEEGRARNRRIELRRLDRSSF